MKDKKAKTPDKTNQMDFKQMLDPDYNKSRAGKIFNLEKFLPKGRINEMRYESNMKP